MWAPTSIWVNIIALGFCKPSFQTWWCWRDCNLHSTSRSALRRVHKSTPQILSDGKNKSLKDRLASQMRLYQFMGSTRSEGTRQLHSRCMNNDEFHWILILVPHYLPDRRDKDAGAAPDHKGRTEEMAVK